MQAGLIHGPEYHYLDHLAPLCALLEIPLILTDSEMVDLATKFYPDLDVIHYNLHEVPDQLVQKFDAIFCSTPRVLFDEVFYFSQAMQNKRVRTIWVPHGNSDKGKHSPHMEALQEEELLLTYGPRMEEFFKEKGVHSNTYRIGNYRLAYFEKHKEFYDSLLEINRPSLLYAPTWQDAEKNSSFPDIWKTLLTCPDEFLLIVKLHPNLYKQFPNEIEELKEKVEVLEDFPPIYPLLSKTDLYIGDMSSIGYDFLAFNRPMILLTPSDLMKAGKVLAKKEYKNLFAYCKEALEIGPPKNSLYKETFSDVNPLYIMKEGQT